MPFTIVRQDITKMQVDVIVNAANTQLLMGGGVCGAIFRAAGPRELQKACNKVAPIKTGGAAITPGFELPAKYIIHAAGPVYHHHDKEKSEKLLREAYASSLELALKYKCESIAFPLISSGIYGYPKAEALSVAVSQIKEFLLKHDMNVYLVIFDKAAFEVSRNLTGEIESYIDENYAEEHRDTRCRLFEAGSRAVYLSEQMPGQKTQVSQGAAMCLDDIVENLEEPFNEALLRLIDSKGKTDVEIYKRANIDRKLFSKIRTGKGYMPGKRTVLALAIALELTLQETDDLLKRAGYALSHSQKFDVIVEYFIISGKYDIFDINQVLFQYDQPLLGTG